MQMEPPEGGAASLAAGVPSVVEKTPVSLLIVDDDEATRESIRLVFDDAFDITGEERYVIQEAGDGDEALAILRASAEPLVVLLDELMPGLTGEEVLRAVLRDRCLRRRHVFILMSAVPHLSRRLRLQRLLRALSIKMLPKPFALEDLEQAIDRARQRLENRSPFTWVPSRWRRF